MTDQTLAVEHQIRPDALMEELGIKKDAYYAYLKHLGIKACKGEGGKAYLEPEQANLIRALRVHVEETGKMEGFADPNVGENLADEGGALAQSGGASPLEQILAATSEDDMDAEGIRRLIYGAGELKVEELLLHQIFQQELAAQMTFEDLPEELQMKVREVREGSGPKFHPAQAASALLGRWRRIQEQNPPEQPVAAQ